MERKIHALNSELSVFNESQLLAGLIGKSRVQEGTLIPHVGVGEGILKEMSRVSPVWLLRGSQAKNGKGKKRVKGLAIPYAKFHS